MVLAPLGALPMCRGAGGLIAQHRFGARGWAPTLLGAVLLALGLLFADGAARLLGNIPAGAFGVLLIVAGSDRALSQRLLEVRADYHPAVAAAAVATFALNPGLGLAADLSDPPLTVQSPISPISISGLSVASWSICSGARATEYCPLSRGRFPGYATGKRTGRFRPNQATVERACFKTWSRGGGDKVSPRSPLSRRGSPPDRKEGHPARRPRVAEL